MKNALYQKRSAGLFIAGWCMIFLIIFLTGSASGNQENSNKEDANVSSLKTSINDALQNELAILEDLKNQQLDNQRIKQAFSIEIGVYQIQYTTYTNMMALQDIQSKTLEKAATAIKASLININADLDNFNRKQEVVQQLQLDSKEQLTTNETYLSDLKETNTKLSDKSEIIRELQKLINIITQKRDSLEALSLFNSSHIRLFEENQRALQSLSEKIEQKLNEKKKSDLFLRQKSYPILEGWPGLAAEIDFLIKEAALVFSFSNINNELNLFWKSARSFIVSSFLLFCLVIMLFFRLKRYCARIEDGVLFNNCPTLRLTITVLNRSIYIFAITLFLFVYTQTGHLYSNSPMISLLLALLQVILFTQWGLDFLSFASPTHCVDISSILKPYLRFFIVLVRFFGLFYVVIFHLVESDSMILCLGRLIFGISIALWCIFFWKKIHNFKTDDASPSSRSALILPAQAIMYTICFGGLVFEFIGYGSIVLYWYASWGKSAVMALWAFMGFIALRELGRVYQVDPNAADEEAETSGAPVKWLFIKIGQLVLCVGFIIAILFAWSGNRAFFLTIFQAIYHPFQIGNIRFSLIGFIYAFLALLITHTIVQLWKYVFQRKVLGRSGLELGLQESITTISVYCIWIIGVMTSLHVFGFNTTSLTVAVGALGIGLGFGLQNIFNNFVSGIILLFERPIQVGDDLEVNGVWATVRKINVRSTVVQTYDNASLIIPNSDLISNQVTNWSFKDKRLRRNITVGVAYGSDIELVRKSLIEAAGNTPRVLKHPKPEVIFTDFGDSALIFKLRIWTNVIYFLAVESEVRFEIDRLFREKDITIAFPQRDVHIYPVKNKIVQDEEQK